MAVTTGQKLSRFASHLDDEGDNVPFTVDTLVELLAYPTGKSVFVLSYFSAHKYKGGGHYDWDATRPKSDHDGGLVVSPTVPWDGSQGASHAAFLAGTGETNPAGLGCWVLKTDAAVVPENYGAVGDGANPDAAPVGKWILSGRRIAAYGVYAIESALPKVIGSLDMTGGKFIPTTYIAGPLINVEASADGQNVSIVGVEIDAQNNVGIGIFISCLSYTLNRLTVHENTVTGIKGEEAATGTFSAYGIFVSGLFKIGSIARNLIDSVEAGDISTEQIPNGIAASGACGTLDIVLNRVLNIGQTSDRGNALNVNYLGETAAYSVNIHKNYVQDACVRAIKLQSPASVKDNELVATENITFDPAQFQFIDAQVAGSDIQDNVMRLDTGAVDVSALAPLVVRNASDNYNENATTVKNNKLYYSGSSPISTNGFITIEIDRGDSEVLAETVIVEDNYNEFPVLSFARVLQTSASNTGEFKIKLHGNETSFGNTYSAQFAYFNGVDSKGIIDIDVQNNKCFDSPTTFLRTIFTNSTGADFKRITIAGNQADVTETANLRANSIAESMSGVTFDDVGSGSAFFASDAPNVVGATGYTSNIYIEKPMEVLARVTNQAATAFAMYDLSGWREYTSSGNL